MDGPVRIVLLDAAAAAADRSALSDVLIDCVAGGAAVTFLAPLAREEAERFWGGVQRRVARGSCRLFAAYIGQGELVGTVQLVLIGAPNQPHRAEIVKLLVHRRARRMGIATALLEAAEREARSLGRMLLTLDTTTGSEADRLYRRLGWQLAGIIPGFSMYAPGELSDAAFFWKRLEP